MSRLEGIETREVLGLDIAAMDWRDALETLSARSGDGFAAVSFINAHNSNLAASKPEYRKAIHGHVILPDGVGMDIASIAAHGKPFPANLNGTDLIPALMTYISTPRRVGLVGASADIVARAADHLAAHAPWHTFVAVSDGYFPVARTREVMDRIAGEKLDILIVAMGTPLQEIWIHRHVRREHAHLVFGVGALFDFLAGEFPRAPEAVRNLRMEWLFRLTQEPKRLASRYLLGIPLFLARVFVSTVEHRFAPGRRRQTTVQPAE